MKFLKHNENLSVYYSLVFYNYGYTIWVWTKFWRPIVEIKRQNKYNIDPDGDLFPEDGSGEFRNPVFEILVTNRHYDIP